jgi:hypothetical protein
MDKNQVLPDKTQKLINALVMYLDNTDKENNTKSNTTTNISTIGITGKETETNENSE